MSITEGSTVTPVNDPIPASRSWRSSIAKRDFTWVTDHIDIRCPLGTEKSCTVKLIQPRQLPNSPTGAENPERHCSEWAAGPQPQPCISRYSTGSRLFNPDSPIISSMTAIYRRDPMVLHVTNTQQQDHPKTTTILVLGILSIVLLPIFGPFAWVMGKGALKEIDASGGRIGGRTNVQIGYILGIIATILFVIVVVGAIAYSLVEGPSEAAALMEAFVL
ncbi:hypothetical protein [Nocardia sp. NPDC052566]|uniref:hypothetical protein n=1 Tax=Nocardia sp. NPDC052566 TaxID=3364330 RepID=UPI0037C8285B